MAETTLSGRVAIGCDMFHVAKNLTNTAAGCTYETPREIPINAVTNDSAEEKATYYFSDHKHDVVVVGNGDEEISFVASQIPLKDLADLIGQKYENGAMLVGAKDKSLWACMWRTTLFDKSHRYHCAMLCDFTRPANSGATMEGTNGTMLELTASVYFTVKEWALTGGVKKALMYTQMDEADAPTGVNLDTKWFEAVPTPEAIAAFATVSG